MGSPKKQRKKYSTPSHPWQRERLDEERILRKEYGLKNKTEIWKMGSVLKGFAVQAKGLIAAKSNQAEKEKKQLLSRAQKLGLISETADLNALLGLGIKNIMERRLQTLVLRKALAKSIDQSRQFITHRHISVGGKKVSQPSYLVSRADEDKISFSPISVLASAEHPERIREEKK